VLQPESLGAGSGAASAGASTATAFEASAGCHFWSCCFGRDHANRFYRRAVAAVTGAWNATLGSVVKPGRWRCDETASLRRNDVLTIAEQRGRLDSAMAQTRPIQRVSADLQRANSIFIQPDPRSANQLFFTEWARNVCEPYLAACAHRDSSRELSDPASLRDGTASIIQSSDELPGRIIFLTMRRYRMLFCLHVLPWRSLSQSGCSARLAFYRPFLGTIG
jgi:hypothetical protein